MNLELISTEVKEEIQENLSEIDRIQERVISIIRKELDNKSREGKKYEIRRVELGKEIGIEISIIDTGVKSRRG